MTTVLTIIILNYNTKKITLDAVNSIEKNYPAQIKSGEFEIILADNASSDGSLEEFKKYKKNTAVKSFHVLANRQNLGFSRGNNAAVLLASGNYILFLNPDTIVGQGTLTHILNFLKKHPDAGAATCKIVHPDGSLDKNCLRGFPTPWNSFCYFSGLSNFFPKSRLFSGYLQSGWRDINKTQIVDAIEGAFIMLPKKVGDKIGWFDEDYFFYGEDLQMCLDIRKAGYNIYYLPGVSITHYGGVSSGIKKQSSYVSTADNLTIKKAQNHRFNAMRIFYQKNYSHNYPFIITWFILKAIDYKYKKSLLASK
jgi:hypothetical protein